MSTITRTVQSTATKEVSIATHEGWDLTFTIEAIGTAASVSVHGKNRDSFMSANHNPDGHVNISFSQGGYDADVASVVAAEMEAIVNPIEE